MHVIPTADSMYSFVMYMCLERGPKTQVGRVRLLSVQAEDYTTKATTTFVEDCTNRALDQLLVHEADCVGGQAGGNEIHQKKSCFPNANALSLVPQDAIPIGHYSSSSAKYGTT